MLSCVDLKELKAFNLMILRAIYKDQSLICSATVQASSLCQ